MRASGAATRCRIWVLAAAAFFLYMSGRAQAYVPYRTPNGTPYHWTRACVAVRVYVDDLPDMTPEQIMKAAEGAAAAWSAAANPCSSMNIVVERAAGPGPQVTLDNAHTITFRRTAWCAMNATQGTCNNYDPAAQALTTVFVSSATGEIRDSDIEVNAKYFVWGDVALDPSGGKDDLQMVLTHEMGHLLGFDHTCVTTGGVLPAPLDDAGKPVPACNVASAEVRATTLFPSAQPNDLGRRTLDPDDQRAVCTTYRSADAGAPAADAGPPSFAACAGLLDGGVDAAGTDGDAGDREASASDGVASDASSSDATMSVKDAASPGDATHDAAPPPPPSSSGCGCSVSETSRAPGALALALVVAMARRRRRARD